MGSLRVHAKFQVLPSLGSGHTRTQGPPHNTPVRRHGIQFFFQNGGRRACDQSSEMKVHLQTSNVSLALKTIVLSENALDSSQNGFLQVCVLEMSNILPVDR